MEQIKALPTKRRRELQEAAGFVIIHRRPEKSEKSERNHDMNTNTTQNDTNTTRPSRAQATLERLTEPPTFKEVAVHELKRAAVWVPMCLSVGIAMLWAERRFFLPRVG